MKKRAAVNVILERSWDPPLDDATMQLMISTAANCLQLHRVAWQGSIMSTDGRELACHFRAPDAESARIALRQAGADTSRLWSGTLHDAPGVSPAEILAANVAVSRRFEAPLEFEAVQALEDAAAECLRMHRVDFVRSYFSNDHRRMLCLYRAPDAESVRIAQHEARMPVDRIWAFRRYRPELTGA
jgi:hypothetical protein